MAIYGSVDIDISTEGVISAKVSMNDDDYTLTPNKKGEVYAVKWQYGNKRSKEVFSNTDTFVLGNMTSNIFDKDKPIYMNGFARTCRPWHLTYFRILTKDYTLLITQDFVDSSTPQHSETNNQAQWLGPLLHQMMS